MSTGTGSLNVLKDELEGLLKKGTIDNDRLITLAHLIAGMEENKVRFSIDAGVIDRLGQELVARQETAVSELVKNSYDADATEVTLSFVNSNNIGGILIIEDNGSGMTRDELVNGFMKISSTGKVHEPVSPLYIRKRAGQKGIGRFAVQRLGDQLVISTQVKNSTDALTLNINWNDYEQDTNLLSISNELEVVDKKREHGTTLVISGLRDKWTSAAIKRVYKYVSDIIQPFPLATLPDSGNTIVDPGFKASFEKVENNEKKVIADESIMVLQHALAVFEGYIDESGIGIYTLDSDKIELNEIGEIGNDPDNKTIPFSLLKNIRFRAYYYIYGNNLIPKGQETSIRNLGRKEGGIRLYRNGFRVLPYAEPGDDWLKLDQSAGKRSLLAPHSNNNFFGFVEMKDLDNQFNETSSREGLIKNDAFIQLQNFVYRTIMTGVVKVASVRKSKITTNQQLDENGQWEDLEVRIQNIALTLDELDRELDEDGTGIEARTRRKKKIKKVKKEIEDVNKLQQVELKKLIKERSMLRVLSSVGLTISQFIHEIKYYMDNIQSDIRYVTDAVKNDEKYSSRMATLTDNFTTFQTYTSYFSDVVSQNVVRELEPQNLKFIVQKFTKSILNDSKRAGIEIIEPKFNKLRLITKPMHPSEWSSILFNLYTNSKKAIKRANSNGKIFIECGEDNEVIYLEFSDNGDGIEKDTENMVFDEFYTTTSSVNFDDLDSQNEILGTGLGLKIVKDIIKSYRGEISVVSPKSVYSTCFRIEISKASEKELDSNGI
ncbi:ATP-binding protein [Pseudoalteromonas sp. A601]|uniref:sensor histidine kinase n=1 Tax=Pseudoalteromonas sp. A601 TaxID=1967839 RepID=UPI001593CFF6|nr:ATP-binding protein [Pseudoalteromonas sp. A601]